MASAATFFKSSLSYSFSFRFNRGFAVTRAAVGNESIGLGLTPETDDAVDGPLSENDQVNPEFQNRNPRNLETMCLARKPKGWAIDYPTRQYWNKVFLEQTSRHTTAQVRHFTGRNVVTASTTEWAIQKFLYSNTDVAAAENIGRVLARRCLESGILHVHAQFTEEEEATDKVGKVVQTGVGGGWTVSARTRENLSAQALGLTLAMHNQVLYDNDVTGLMKYFQAW